MFVNGWSQTETFFTVWVNGARRASAESHPCSGVAELQGGQEPQLVAGCRPEHITRLRPPPRDLVHHPPRVAIAWSNSRQTLEEPFVEPPPPPSPSVVLPYSSECVGHVCMCVYVRARDCTYVKIDLSSSFLSLPSFLPFSLPVFNFFNSATQGGGKLISITKHDRLVCTGFLSGIYGVRFLKEKETDRRIFHELVSPPQNRKERNTRNPYLIELDFWIHRQGFFFTSFDRCLWKEREGGKEKEERENWIAAFRKLEIATK